MYTKVKGNRLSESAHSERFKHDEGRCKSHILYMGPAPAKYRLLIKWLSLGGVHPITTGITILENQSIQHFPES